MMVKPEPMPWVVSAHLGTWDHTRSHPQARVASLQTTVVASTLQACHKAWEALISTAPRTLGAATGGQAETLLNSNLVNDPFTGHLPHHSSTARP